MKYAKTRNPAQIPVSFRYWFGGKPHKFSLKPGQEAHLYEHRYTDEGHNSESVRLSVSQYDWTLGVAVRLDGQDCDGRMQHFWEAWCPRHLRHESRNYGYVKSPRKHRENYPMWTTLDRSQRDYTAESMGY